MRAAKAGLLLAVPAPLLGGLLVADAGSISAALGVGTASVRFALALLLLGFGAGGQLVARRDIWWWPTAPAGTVATGALVLLAAQVGGGGGLALVGLLAGLLLAATAGRAPAAVGTHVELWWPLALASLGLGGLLASGLTAGGFTWRVHLAVAGIVLLVIGAMTLAAAGGAVLMGRPVATTREASVAQVRAIPTVGQSLVVASLVGAVAVMLPGRLAAMLQMRDQLAAPGRTTLVSVVVVGAALGFLVERLLGSSRLPASLEPLALLIGVSAALLLLAPHLPRALAVAACLLAMAAVAAILTRCASAIAATVPTVALPSGLATMSSSVFLLGTAVGSFVLGGVATRYGEGTALALLAAPLLLALAPGRRLATTLAADAARLVSDQESAARVAADVAAGRHLPLLACRGVDYAYGQLQVLFGVDFTVDEGELVALLGTNGAGKSSLLRAVSGLGLPTGGTIHLRGREITRLPAAARVGLGVVQVPGGRAVFPPLSVVDNLRVYANSLGRDRRAVDRGLDRSFELFPALAAARNKPAGALSGGQQQMLALSKALILRPELLLIDELSLGLAPKVVGELLEAVRAINADGTAVVLVEQSVNVAASVATHAYFMEKGRVLFDGPTAGLMERTDLLRAVFLGDTDPSGTSKRR